MTTHSKQEVIARIYEVFGDDRRTLDLTVPFYLHPEDYALVVEAIRLSPVEWLDVNRNGDRWRRLVEEPNPLINPTPTIFGHPVLVVRGVPRIFDPR